MRPFIAAQLQQLAAWLRRGGNGNLLLVNTVVCGGLYGLGDVCQQKITGNGTNDWRRTTRMTTLGVLMGPVNHYWYWALDFVMPGRAGKTVLKKVLADQLVMAPVCCVLFYTGEQSGVLYGILITSVISVALQLTLIIYWSGMCTLEGKSSMQAMEELKVKFWPTYKVGVAYCRAAWGKLLCSYTILIWQNLLCYQAIVFFRILTPCFLD